MRLLLFLFMTYSTIGHVQSSQSRGRKGGGQVSVFRVQKKIFAMDAKLKMEGRCVTHNNLLYASLFLRGQR